MWRYSPVDVMMVFVGVGRWCRCGRVGFVVHGAEVVAALGRGTEVGAAAAQVGAVGGAGARRARLEHLLEVRVGLHVARVCRRRPQLLVAARVGRRQRARVGVAERRQGGRALRVAAAALRAALRLALCAHAHYVTVTLHTCAVRSELIGARRHHIA